MKNVVILGANGRTSRQVINCLLKQNDVNLTLFLRNPKRLGSILQQKVRVVEGDARQPQALLEAIRGQDIVISTMGGMDLAEKTSAVVACMQECEVARLIAISAGGIYDELPEPFNTWDKQMTGYTRPSNLEAVKVIEASRLTYTILRPVWLTDNTSQAYQLTSKGQMFTGTETSRAGLASFIAEIVRNPQLQTNANLGVSQPDTDGARPAAYR